MKSAILDQLMSLVSKGIIPGGSYAIIDRNQGIDIETFGFFQLKPTPVANRTDVIYDVASLTKTVSTTTLIMMLVEKKMIQLDTPIYSFLPFKMDPSISFFDCLTHSSGLAADLPKAFTLQNKEDVIKRIIEQKPIYSKGTHIVYSDIGFILLGLAIETLLNMPLDEAADQWIFKPLGMNDTGYHPETSRTAPTEFRNDPVFQGVLQGRVHDDKAFAMGGVAGHAGVFSTDHDLAVFAKHILDGTFPLHSESLDMLFSTALERPDLKGTMLKRGIGWDKPTGRSSAGQFADPEATILHTGFTGCNMFIDRKHGLGFVLLTNDVHPSRDQKGVMEIRHELANIVYRERRNIR